MSESTKKLDNVTTLGDHHTPAPPAQDTVTTLGDHHTPAPPAS
ncbi:hypothetical protein [Streptomyces sp. WAC05374]|nr:hypothetical protein [Streptomyces sp. WAC05374]